MSSCRIGGCVIGVLCALAVVSGMYFVYSRYLPYLQAVKEMGQCLHGEATEAKGIFESGDVRGALACKQLKEHCGEDFNMPNVPNSSIAVDEGRGFLHAITLAEKGDPTCLELRKDCMCGMLTFLVEVKDPPLADRVHGCCDAFEGGAVGGKQWCLDLGTKAVEKVEQNQAKECANVTTLTAQGVPHVLKTTLKGLTPFETPLESAWDHPDFEMAWRPSVITETAFVFVGALAIGLIVTALSIRGLWRRQHASIRDATLHQSLAPASNAAA